jgi:hypothetical protein
MIQGLAAKDTSDYATAARQGLIDMLGGILFGRPNTRGEVHEDRERWRTNSRRWPIARTSDACYVASSTCAKWGETVSPTATFCPACAHPTGLLAAPRPARFESPESYIPKHLAERILTSKAALDGEAEAGDRALRRPEGLEGVPGPLGP